MITPDAVIVPPPGGLVNWTVTGTSGPAGHGFWKSSSNTPSNDTGLEFRVLNWTLRSVSASGVAALTGPGACPKYSLTASDFSYGSFIGGIPGGAAPAGVGERSEVPAHIQGDWLPGDLGGYPSVELNGTYGAAPIATFSWTPSPVDQVDVHSTSDLASLFSLVGPMRLNGSFLGLRLVANFEKISFAVPISSNGNPLGTFDASVPDSFPGATLAIRATYIFPAASDQGTWAVYPAGGGSSYPLGGYLFVRLA